MVMQHQSQISMEGNVVQTNSLSAAADKAFLKIAQGSFDGELLGYLASYSYDESEPELGYVGGADKWNDFSSQTKKYRFKKNGQEILQRHADDIAEEVVKYTGEEHSVHFYSIAPGTQFEEQDIHLVRAFNNAAMGRKISLCTILDINADFARKPRELLNREFPSMYAASAVHDIYREPITQSIHGNPFGTERKSVALYTGGTVGNIAMRRRDKGFPERQLTSHLQLQFDYSADESYLVLAHNTQTSQDVLDNYSEEVHERFALGSLHNIAHRLPTDNFDPESFAYDNFYDHQTGLVAHNAVSKKAQTFRIGNKTYKCQKGDVAARIGNSFQISNDRMGEMTAKAEIIRLRSFSSADNCTTFQVLKASRNLITKLRARNGYIPR